MTDDPPIEIRRIAAAELPDIADLVRELRPHLDLALLRQRFAEQEALGYELHAAFIDRAPVALAGFRSVVTLVRGHFLHLDDLVVGEAHQGSGLGRIMLAYVEEQARTRGDGAVFLDARPAAIPFYERCGYAPHRSPSYTRSVKS